MSIPGPHPPPPDLSGLSLPVVERQDRWLRHHQPQYAALFFGRTGECRFDAPAPARAFGVLYLAADEHGAFIETFGHGHAGAARIVTEAALARKRLAVVEFDRPLRLVDLTASGLARIGADARLFSGDYDASQAWSGALHEHPAAPDGILYRARHDSSRLCAAVYDRAQASARTRDDGTLADPAHRHLLGRILDDYDFGLLP